MKIPNIFKFFPFFETFRRQFPAGFFPGGTGSSPQVAKILPVPLQPTAVPTFCSEPVPPNWVLHPQKFRLIFLLILTTFSSKLHQKALFYA